MKRVSAVILAVIVCTIGMLGCAKPDKNVKIGVSFGVGEAARWPLESDYMKEAAKNISKENGVEVEIEVRLNKTDKPKTQEQDCTEMIDSGIDVLIITPRDANKSVDVIKYAKSKNVPVISYSRLVLGIPVDLYIGYDNDKTGQYLGRHLAETVYQGDYIVLSGDAGDNNARLLNEGAMKFLEPLGQDINIILQSSVPGWSTEAAKKMVKQAIIENNNNIDAIFAPNDKIAGACAEVIEELGIEKHVAITGMDAEIDALKRIVKGTQDVTVHLDLKTLAQTAIKDAYNIAKKQKVTINSECDNKSTQTIKANLIMGQLVTKQNIDNILIKPGYFTFHEIYG